ncbi:uncharacterized protein LOC142214611 [Leptodactylus fuscus]|uniref:uncharacterized protein LOC142214611 n=1 Tax=Leptodactylus fuscus TaxID=238119 RepID=UPI003F4F2B60
MGLGSVYVHSTSTLRPFYVDSTSTLRPLYVHSTSTLRPFYVHSTFTLRPFYVHSTFTLRPPLFCGYTYIGLRTSAHFSFYEGESKLCDKSAITLNGILGKSLVLYQLPKDLKYERLTLKSINTDRRKKFLVYDPKTGTQSPNISREKFQFNKETSSVMIHKLQKDDEKDYELLVDVSDGEEDFCNFELKIYEQISNLTVSVTEDSQNNTCKVTMKCQMRTGENVTFSWMKDDESLGHDSSTLQISISNDNANSTYTCTARNPVSEASSHHQLSSACNPEKDVGHFGLFLYILISLCVVLIVVAIMGVTKCCNKAMYTKQCTNHSSTPQSRPPPPEPVSEPVTEPNQTVYGQVEKPKHESPKMPEPSTPSMSSVYELAGPCRNDLQSWRVNEETRRTEAPAVSSVGEPISAMDPTLSLCS